jgi:hypothetical protein
MALGAVLDVEHLDQNHSNNDPDSLVWLCKTHHWMHGAGLYPTKGGKLLRDHWQVSKGMNEPMCGVFLVKIECTTPVTAFGTADWGTLRQGRLLEISGASDPKEDVAMEARDASLASTGLHPIQQG